MGRTADVWGMSWMGIAGNKLNVRFGQADCRAGMGVGRQTSEAVGGTNNNPFSAAVLGG